MAKKNLTLIHTALFREAEPLIRYFGLRQFETKPFKVFRSRMIVLIVSGVGKVFTQEAMAWILARYQFSSAINIGLAGCNDATVPIGQLVRVHGSLEALPLMPLKTFDSPLRADDDLASTLPVPSLVDMEASYFTESVSPYFGIGDIHVLKVVSDYLSDVIQNRDRIGTLIGDTLSQWGHLADSYPQKLFQVLESSPSTALVSEDREAIRNAGMQFRFSHQELKNLVDMAIDFRMWGLESLESRLRKKFQSRNQVYKQLAREWELARSQTKTYRDFKGESYSATLDSKKVVDLEGEGLGFGRCPVASTKTRCCNLLTLDAVEGCSFDCSYCSIRYFYDSSHIRFKRDFVENLRSLEIDPEKTYHIGTGQASDSLMWGNRSGVLEALLNFASRNPNVILEFKTKSDNISQLLEHEIPANVVTTWSLNPQIIIDNEEHHTASLKRRIDCARAIAARGNLVGFHFHPMILYEDWESDYGEIISQLIRDFSPDEVMMVSFGTLTFIKSLLKKMRENPRRSRILQMPLEESEGKLSYPLDVKRRMFRFAYQNFAPWHGKVFFYLCMENISLWPDVFSYDYRDNDDFERAMLEFYSGKVERVRKS